MPKYIGWNYGNECLSGKLKNFSLLVQEVVSQKKDFLGTRLT
jgi:hypothetical protein